jgi:hypothetical protein
VSPSRVTAHVAVAPKASSSARAGTPSSPASVSSPTVAAPVPVSKAASTVKRIPPVVESLKRARAHVAPVHRPTSSVGGRVATSPIAAASSSQGSLPPLRAVPPLTLPWQTPLPSQQAAPSASVAAAAAPGDSHPALPSRSIFDAFGAAAGAAFSSHGLQALPAPIVFGLALAGFALLLLLEQQRLRPARLWFRLERPG